jgi:methylmalonyl-CoA/ethylmalonyl-CoA epimerase
MQFDHVGVAVKRLNTGRKHLSGVFEIERWTEVFDDSVNRVSVQFGLDPSGICYEIIAPLGDASPIAEALRTGGRILNHVAYRVPDLAASAARLDDKGCVPAGEPKPAVAYGGCAIQFFISPLNLIIELIEAPHHAHVFSRLPPS